MRVDRVCGSLQQVPPNRELPGIRVAIDSDCESLADMRLRLQQLLEQESPALWRMTEARRAALPEFYAQCIHDRDVRVLVAEVQEEGTQHIVATAVGRIEVGRDVARFGSIEDVWVEPAYRGQGYAYESAVACRDYGADVLGLERIVAFTTLDNEASGKLLVRLGFKYEGTIPWGKEGDLSTVYAYTP